MSEDRDIEMNDGIRVKGASESGSPFYLASEAGRPNSDQAPSWVSSLISLLTKFITNQESVRRQEGVPENVRPRNSQPHPEKFSEVDASQYPQFRTLQRIHPWVELSKGKKDFTVVEFFSHLDKAFGDPEKITKAIENLNSIRQGNRGFREFLQDFEQTLLEAQAWDWSDEAKKGYLRSGLNRDLTDRLVSQAEPHAYEDFVSQLRMTSDNMEGMKSWDNRRNRNRAFNSQPPATADIENNGDPMDWEPTLTVNIAAV
ncbi:hypothetical protein K3495_g10461 [Podosphaera aphanis]|nr:hypothetical protein K3495_g10461 [Podosphaera aphanis]